MLTGIDRREHADFVLARCDPCARPSPRRRRLPEAVRRSRSECIRHARDQCGVETSPVCTLPDTTQRRGCAERVLGNHRVAVHRRAIERRHVERRRRRLRHDASVCVAKVGCVPCGRSSRPPPTAVRAHRRARSFRESGASVAYRLSSRTTCPSSGRISFDIASRTAASDPGSEKSAARDAGRGAAQHGGRADLVEAEHPKQLAEAVEPFVKSAAIAS